MRKVVKSMLKVSNFDSVNSKKSQKNSSLATEKTEASKSMRRNSQSSKALPRLTQEHYKANFVPNFGMKVTPPDGSVPPNGNSSPLKDPKLSPEEQEFAKMIQKALGANGGNGSQPPMIRQVYIGLDAWDAISMIPSDELNKSDHYQKQADNVAALITPNKSALVVHEDGVSDEMLTHKFVRSLRDDRYAKAGLTPENTDIFVLDSKVLMNKHNILPHSFLEGQFDVDGRKKVVFVKNVHGLIMGLLAKKLSPEEFLGEDKLPDVHIVGLMPKIVYDAAMNPSPKLNPPFDPDHVDYLGTTSMKGVPTRATKDLLKKDPSYIGQITNRYESWSKIKVTPQAIDELVDRSYVKLEGAFPNKALKALDLAIGLKLNEPSHHKDGSEYVITSTDIKNLFEDPSKSDILASLSVRSGRFKIAENVKTRFSDVGGIEEVKEAIDEKIISYIKNPKEYKESGQKPPKGFLMLGDPGNGKTLVARAIAGEAGVPFIAASGSEFVQKYVGEGAARVRELFDLARSAAESSEHKLAIIFIDEADAIAKKRGSSADVGSAESGQTLNELLVQMDGFNNKDSDVRVIVLAATNREDVLDPAFVRPGRFDDKIQVPNPSGNLKARKEILSIHAKNKPFESPEARAAIVHETALFTDGMSGAELADVFDKAVGVVAKRDDKKFITPNDVTEGYLRVKAGRIKNTPSEFSKDHGMKSVRHEWGHATGMLTLGKMNNEKISFVTLEPRDNFLAAVFYHKKVQDLPNFESTIASIAVDYLGGLSEPNYAEKGHAAGVSGDLGAATNLIEESILKRGLGVHTPQLSIDKKSPLYEVFKPEIRKDMLLMSETGLKVGKMIEAFHRDFMDEGTRMFEANTGKGGNSLSGAGFEGLHADWLKRTGKEKDFAILQKRIAKVIEKARNANKGPLTKTKEFVVRTLKLAA